MAESAPVEYYTDADINKPLRHPTFKIPKVRPTPEKVFRKPQVKTNRHVVPMIPNKITGIVDIELSDQHYDIKNYYTQIVFISFTVTIGLKSSMYMFAVCDLGLKCGTMCFDSEKEMLEKWKHVVVNVTKCESLICNNDLGYLFNRCKLLGVL